VDSLSIDDLEGIEGIVRSDFFKHKIQNGIDVVSFLAETNIFSSKGEARKMIQNGGVSINRKKVENVQMAINATLLLHDKYILVQKGRKNYYLVKII
jgi:tyrosyl-tRNA synthetase